MNQTKINNDIKKMSYSCYDNSIKRAKKDKERVRKLSLSKKRNTLNGLNQKGYGFTQIIRKNLLKWRAQLFTEIKTNGWCLLSLRKLRNRIIKLLNTLKNEQRIEYR